MKTKITPRGWMVADEDSHISKWIEESDRLDHDQHLIPLACSHIKPGDCVIDAGANVGSHSVAYSKAVGKDGIVIAIEPGKVAFDCLMHNVELFPFKNTMPIKAALSDKDGDTVAHEENINLGASTCTPILKEHQVPGNTYLLTVTLDFIASQVKKPINFDFIASQVQKPINFIKLDIEGWEVDALIGASHILRDHRPTLLIEVNPGALELRGCFTDDLLDILKYHRYTWNICQTNCVITDPQFDILAIPSDAIPSQ